SPPRPWPRTRRARTLATARPPVPSPSIERRPCRPPFDRPQRQERCEGLVAEVAPAQRRPLEPDAFQRRGDLAHSTFAHPEARAVEAAGRLAVQALGEHEPSARCEHAADLAEAVLDRGPELQRVHAACVREAGVVEGELAGAALAELDASLAN